MKKTNWRVIVPVLAAILLLSALIYIHQRNGGNKMISEFGKYQGYSKAVYDGTQRISDYLMLSDGTRLAYDLIIPTKKGVPADQPLPVLFKYTPYGRAWTVFDKKGKFLLSDFASLDWFSKAMLRIRYILMGDKGRVLDPLFRDSWLGGVVNHGYIVVSVDRPGTGASFSSPTPGSMETAAKFENEIMNWIVAQPWSDGNIGMYGDSQQAVVQFAAVAEGNPHLKAILPAASWMEPYQAVEFPGGVYNKAFAALYASTVPYLDRLVTPVDSDPDGALLAQALESRKNTGSSQVTLDTLAQSPFHDSVAPQGINPWQAMDLNPFIDRINQSHTAVYLTVGWYDLFTADMFYWYDNLSVPKHLTVRPTDHSQVSANLNDLNYGTEALRWFDYWLKGIDNGIMDEAPIHYYVQDGPKKGTWQISDQWPLESQKLTAYYFDQAKSGGITPAKGGLLTGQLPTVSNTFDAYTVDYTTTTGKESRWVAVDSAHHYPDMRLNDAKALSYMTEALGSDVQVTGHAIVHLWLSTAAPDLDVFAYLEEVDAAGKSTYITEGDLRASHRQLSPAPFNNMGLPFHTHNQSDLEAIPAGQPFELVFSLLPTAYVFHKGNSLRITIAFADAGNFETPVLNPAPTLQLLRDVAHPSYIEIPVIHRP